MVKFPSTREAGLERLEEFLASAAAYAAKRNHVLPGHPHVSRLSAAIRHRLITESEVVEATLRRYPFSAVEKFLQEVLWRSYWKGWLEMRPQVWAGYIQAVQRRASDGERARAVAEGRSRSGIMNHFARELLETGYLHNHARMWWASYWIHHCGLPWELGADHFFRHLLDADPASNTLSWRWVAGLQTRGKTYLATAQNIAKFCAPEIIDSAGGVGLVDGVSARMVTGEDGNDSVLPLEKFPGECAIPEKNERAVVVLHDEDFCLENGPLAVVRPVVVLQYVPGTRSPVPAPRAEWLAEARADAARRAKSHFGCEVQVCSGRQELQRACLAKDATSLFVMELFTGPLRDDLGGLPDELAARGVRVMRLRRRWDSNLLQHAARGFFPFWNKVGRLLARSGTENLG